MKYILISSVGENMDVLFTSIREFPTEHLILISPEYEKNVAEKIKKELTRFKIPVKIYEIKGDIWEETLATSWEDS